VEDKLFIMDYNLQKIGEIVKTKNSFIQTLHGKTEMFQTLPRILSGIAPAPTQFPAANDVLDYYQMDRMDVWEYLKRSNGIKISRDVWFMSEPVGEIWVPFFLSQRYPSFGSRLRVGVEARVLMNGQLYSLRRPLDILPPVLKDYLAKDGETRFSTVTGVVYDLAPHPADKDLIGRIILNFSKKEDLLRPATAQN